MSTHDEFRAARRAKHIVIALAVCVLFDVIVIATSISLRYTFVHAPNNESLQPSDDPGYFLAGIVYELSSALRDLVIVAALAVLARWWAAARVSPATGSSGPRLTGLLLPAALIGSEVVATSVAWSSDTPTELFVIVRIAACVVNGVLCAGAIARLGVQARRPEPGPDCAHT